MGAEKWTMSSIIYLICVDIFIKTSAKNVAPTIENE